MGALLEIDVSESNFVDFDIHGIVGIRLVNPSKSDTLAVSRQLGPLRVNSLNREPDIIIRFEKHLPLTGLHFLGLNDAGYTKDGFFVLRSKKASAKARIPFDCIGDRCEILCETGLLAVPLLIPILNLTLLKKDCIPLHASAFEYKDVGILVTGWSKGGKTEALLAFGSHGAKYVGDEWVILAKDGRNMYGLPEPIHIWDWQLRQLPKISSKIKLSRRLLFKAISTLDILHARLQIGALKRSSMTEIMHEVMPALKRQLHATVLPAQIFDDKTFALRARPEKLFFLVSHAESSIHIEPWDHDDIATRMLHSVRYEQAPFFEYYQAFKFAFPETENNFLEGVPELQSYLLRCALENKEAYKVLHPYPVCLDDLFKEMEPFCHAVTNRMAT